MQQVRQVALNEVQFHFDERSLNMKRQFCRAAANALIKSLKMKRAPNPSRILQVFVTSADL